MSLSDDEIIELERLLKEKDISEKVTLLSNPVKGKSSPNYLALHEAIESQRWELDDKGVPRLAEGYAGFILEGSSRSTKTWSGIDIIIWLGMIKHKDDGCTINIYRETYNEFKTTLYDDFKRRLDDYDLPNKFHYNDEVKLFRIGKSKIQFLGDGKHGGSSDYAFFNEVMMQDYRVFDQVEMRCRKFWWMDYNPSFTRHWVFDKVEKRKDVGFLRTTFKDNPFIAPTEINKILGYEPWLPGSYEVVDEELYYNNDLISDSNQPPIHPINVESGTANVFMWKCYGLGLRGAMKGVIFSNVTYIDKFPELDFTYGMDFGFTADPTVIVKYAEEGNNIYLECLSYSPMETPEEIDEYANSIGLDKDKLTTADSSDKYINDKGEVEMVKSLKKKGWLIKKVRKTKGKMFWILSMKEKKIHIVKGSFYDQVKEEQQNYKMKEVQGIQINQPIDGFDHFWDASRYGHMAHNQKRSNNLEIDVF